MKWCEGWSFPHWHKSLLETLQVLLLILVSVSVSSSTFSQLLQFTPGPGAKFLQTVRMTILKPDSESNEHFKNHWQWAWEPAVTKQHYTRCWWMHCGINECTAVIVQRQVCEWRFVVELPWAAHSELSPTLPGSLWELRGTVTTHKHTVLTTIFHRIISVSTDTTVINQLFCLSVNSSTYDACFWNTLPDYLRNCVLSTDILKCH